METNTENTEQVPPETGLSFPCDQCPRIFPSRPSLSMHKVRTHGKGWSTVRNFNKPKLRSPEERRNADALRKRREYQRKLRATYKVTNRDSRGYPLPVAKENLRETGWSPARREHFKKTWEKKRRKEAQRNKLMVSQVVDRLQPGKKRTQFVWPLPPEKVTEEAKSLQPTGAALDWVHAQLHFCPKCGEDITRWKRS